MIGSKPQYIESANFPRKPGEKLPNGGIILVEEQIRCYAYRRDSIVLAVVPGKTYEAFASWHRIVTTDSPLATGGYQVVDTCSSGEYDRTIHEALEAFGKRVDEALGRLDDWST
jgi:hypothetical protein